MNLRFDWLAPLVIAALFVLLVVGYRLLPSAGWLGRIGRGGIVVLAVLILAMMVWNTVEVWRGR